MTAPLVEVTDAPGGLIELKAKDSKGVRIGFFQVSADELDDQLLEDLRAWQRRHAHHGLKLLPPSASTG